MNGEVNIPLLRKAVEWAEAEAAKPFETREWDQTFWALPASPNDPNVCGNPFQSQAVLDRLRGEVDCGTKFCVAGWIVHAAGEAVLYYDAATRAAELLGVTIDAADALFVADNSIEDVRRIAEELAGERL